MQTRLLSSQPRGAESTRGRAKGIGRRRGRRCAPCAAAGPLAGDTSGGGCARTRALRPRRPVLLVIQRGQCCAHVSITPENDGGGMRHTRTPWWLRYGSVGPRGEDCVNEL